MQINPEKLYSLKYSLSMNIRHLIEKVIEIKNIKGCIIDDLQGRRWSRGLASDNEWSFDLLITNHVTRRRIPTIIHIKNVEQLFDPDAFRRLDEEASIPTYEISFKSLAELRLMYIIYQSITIVRDGIELAVSTVINRAATTVHITPDPTTKCLFDTKAV